MKYQAETFTITQKYRIRFDTRTENEANEAYSSDKRRDTIRKWQLWAEKKNGSKVASRVPARVQIVPGGSREQLENNVSLSGDIGLSI